MSDRNKKTVFLTGATGLIGSYLLKILLQNNYKVYVLARNKNNKTAEERVRGVLNFWDEDVINTTPHINKLEQKGIKMSLRAEGEAISKACPEQSEWNEIPRYSRNDIFGVNYHILEGDITKKNLGLDEKQLDLLKSEIDEVFHSAASTQFNLPLEEIRKHNVEGTRNVLELALRCKKEGKLEKVNYLSTIYVCGDFKRLFKEGDLDVGQGFNSTYEQSKFEAEKLVDGYRREGLWIDIFRPPLVVGESLTGKTITFQQGVYQLFHMWSLEIFDYFPAKKFSVNIVFVDELCNALFMISSRNEIPRYTQNDILGANYHLFNNKTVSLETMINISSEFLGFRKPVLVSREDFFRNNPTPAQRMLLQNNILLYNSKVMFDSTRTNTLLKGYGFEFSDFNRDSFLKVLEYCVREGFFKRKGNHGEA